MSDNGVHVVITRFPEGTRVVDVRDDREISSIRTVEVNVAQFSPDGRLAAINDVGGDRIVIVDLENGSIASIGTSDEVPFGLWVDFSPDGAELAIASLGGDISLLDTGDLLAGSEPAEALRLRFAAHDSLVVPVVFSPDGTMLASMAHDSPARLWRVDTGELVAEFGTSADRTAVAFHPGEPWVYVSEDGTITRHTLDIDELIDTARESLTRTLADDECRRYLERGCN